MADNANKFQSDECRASVLTYCNCSLCRQMRETNGEKCPPNRLKEVDSDHYCEWSTVDGQKTRIKKLVDAHWSYMKKALTTGQDPSQIFTWEQVMQMREFDYTSAAIHFYGHGFEDAKNGD